MNQGYLYDSAGNLTNDTFHNYSFDAEGRLKSVDSTAATYTYDANSNRVRKDMSGSDPAEYVYFQGQIVAEHDPSNGNWSDYIYANGQRVARGDNFFHEIDLGGTNSTNSQASTFRFSNPGGLTNYVIRSGDKLYFYQYEWSGTEGGMSLYFTDGSSTSWNAVDQYGEYINQQATTGVGRTRIVDLSSFSGKQVASVKLVDETGTAAGNWGISFHDIALINGDGTVTSVYNGQTADPVYFDWTNGATNQSSSVGLWPGRYDPNLSTTYYQQDHLGTARLIVSHGGYPVWQGTFAPFGQEANPQMTMNHYKFTDLEHDAESNLEHTQFRQLSTTQGRWLSPDPYMGSMDLTNPQSLNRYAYVANNPLSAVDPTGLDQANPGFCPAEFENCDGGGGSGGGGTGGGGGDPCLGGDGIDCPPFPFPIPIPFPVDPGGGGGAAPAPGAPSSPPNINPSGKPPLSGETLGIPTSVHIHIPSILQTLGLAPNDPACDFIACTTVGDGYQLQLAIPVCVAQPELCVLGGLGILGLSYIATHPMPPISFSRNIGENRQFKEAVRQIGNRCGRSLTADEKERLHREISKQGHGLDDIVEIGVAMFCPGK